MKINKGLLMNTDLGGHVAQSTQPNLDIAGLNA